MRRVVFSFVMAMLVLVAAGVLAQIPRVINYQGMLLETTGQAIADGDYKLTFSLYDETSALIWTETHYQVFVEAGLFQVMLGTVTPFGIPFNKPYFLGIQVGSDPELQPRMPLCSVAYAIRAEDADKLMGIFVSTTPEPNKLLPLDASGKIPASVISGGVSGDFLKKNEPDTSRGNSGDPLLLISNQGDGDGINGRSLDGRGIEGRSDNGHGVHGWTGASDKSGVSGYSVDGTGVEGRSDNNDGVTGWTGSGSNQGVYGYSTDGIGVMGSSTNNHGLYGESENLRGVKGVSPAGGVYGESTQGWGVEGRSENSDGVSGWTNNSSKSGVWGRSTPGVGVTGRSENNDGVVGITASSQPGNAGVRARNEGGGPAVYCEGDLYVTGAVRGNLGPNQNGASFPRPAWNSGWVPLPYIPGNAFRMTHGVGGNVDDYVIDIQFRDDNWYGIHQINYGTGKDKDGRWTGAHYSNLTNQSVDITRAEDDPWCDEVRVRIWICQ